MLRAGASEIAIATKPAGSTMPPTEKLVAADWSRFRSVNGQETVVNRPFALPLTMGKSWTIEYTENHPNREHSSEHMKSVYTVTGWEDVTVAGGTFHAVKVETDGRWTAVLAPGIAAASGARVDAQGTTTVMQTNRITPATFSERTYKAFWYAPTVKRWVKSVEEYYDANGTRTERFTNELAAYTVAN